MTLRSLLACGILLLAACKSGGSAPPNTGPAPADPALSRAIADSTWQKGLKDFRQGAYRSASEAFQRALLEFAPGDPRIPEAHFYLGESYFGSGSQLQAVREFRKVSDDFPSNPLAPDALYRAGDAYSTLWRKPPLDPTYGQSAMATYTELLNRYPDSPARVQGAGAAHRAGEQVCLQGMGNREILPAEQAVRVGHSLHEGARGCLPEHAVGAAGADAAGVDLYEAGIRGGRRRDVRSAAAVPSGHEEPRQALPGRRRLSR